MNEKDPEDLDGGQSANLISEKPKEQPDIPFCGCMSVRYYQPYFDVDTADVASRLTAAVIFCKSEQNFLSFIGDRPDAYGPFWISTTLVFTLAVASHLNGFLSSWMKGGSWVYDFQSVLTASSLVYSYAFFAPLAIWFVFKQFEKNLKFVSVLSLYGYSLTVMIPAVLLCLVPSELFCWVALFVAAVISTLFLLRSLGPILVTQNSKQTPLILGAVGVTQLSLVLFMKFYFFYEK